MIIQIALGIVLGYFLIGLMLQPIFWSIILRLIASYLSIYRGVLEGHGADPSSATQISSGRPQLSARQNFSMFGSIANKNIVVNHKYSHIITIY